MRYSGLKRIVSIMCALIMTTVIFQNVSAGDYNSGEDMDIFTDQFGNKHMVWRELVNGTYQLFYGYEVVDTIYNTNEQSYTEQALNNNINFDDGYLTITNCTVNGNIKVTRGHVQIQDSQINGNVKLDLGTMVIRSCSINGNVEIKNAGLELRTSNINGNVKTNANTEDSYSIIVTGNEINGNIDLKSGTCFVVGNTINGNLKVKEPAIIQEVSDNVVNGNTQLTENTGGFNGCQITNSTSNVMYPQVTIDPVSNITYLLWVTEGTTSLEFWYCGSQDTIEWSEARYGGILPLPGENPELELTAYNYSLYITWKYGGSLTIVPDTDCDFIPDNVDPNPFEFNIDGNTTFAVDSVVVNEELKISVAVDFVNNITLKPMISIAECSLLNGSIGFYVNISLDTNDSFVTIIKCIYNPATLPANVTEKYLRMYWLTGEKWLILKNESAGEDTNVDLEGQCVWAKSSHLSTFTVADSTAVDSDEDDLTDAEEINAGGKVPVSIETFSDDTSTKEIHFTEGSEEIVNIKFPVSIDAIERTDTATVDLTGVGYATQYVIDDNTHNSKNPKVEAGDTGQIYMVWLDDRTGENQVYFKVRHPDGSYTNDGRLSPEDDMEASQVDIAVDGNLIFIVYVYPPLGSWNPPEWSPPRVMYVRGSYQPITGEVLWINNPNPIIGSGTRPSVAVHGNDIYVAIQGASNPAHWNGYEGLSLYVAHSPNGGLTWDENTFFLHSSVYESSIPKIVATDGFTCIIWERGGTLFYSYKSGFGGWQWTDEPYPEITSFELHDEFTPDSFDVIAKQTVLHPTPTLFLTWEVKESFFTTGIYYKHGSPGLVETWSDDIKISSLDAGLALHPSCAVDSSNNVHVAWQEYNTAMTVSSIQYFSLNPDDAILYEKEFSGTGGNYEAPALCIDTLHNLNIVFEECKDADYDLKLITGPASHALIDIDIGDDGSIDWGSQELVIDPITTSDLSVKINWYVVNAVVTDDDYLIGYILVPISISSSTNGKITLSDLYIQIYEVDTDPVDWDTDDDGLSDGEEHFGTKNTHYGNMPTNPCNPDHDGDKISDGDEVYGTFHGFFSNPIEPDTDNDNIADGIEVNVLSAEDATITTFSGGVTGKEIIFTEPGSATVTFEIPMHQYAMEYVTQAQLQITGLPYLDTDRTGYEPRLAMNDHRVFWADNRNDNYDIYSFNYITGVETQITTNTADQVEPAVFGNTLVWTDYRHDPNNGEIYYCNPEIQPIVERRITITTNEICDFDPAIYGNKIVWTREEHNQLDIMLCDISGSPITEKKIVNDPIYSQFDPSIYGNKVVWTDTRNGNRDIFYHDIKTKIYTQITSNLADQDFPFVFENRIIWRDFMNNGCDLNSYNLVNQDYSSITNTPTILEISPIIWNNGIVWTSYNNQQFDVLDYSLVNGNWVTTVLTEPTNNQLFAMPYEDRIAWLNYSPGNTKLELYSLGINPQVDISVSKDTAQKGENINFQGIVSNPVEITTFKWFSNRDGLISQAQSFWTDDLSQGTHVITFTVRGTNGLWSEPALKEITIVNSKPIAQTNSITPSSVIKGSGPQIITFTGSGNDQDGLIIKYRWISSLDGFIKEQETSTLILDLNTHLLSSGEHKIYLSVQDEAGEWSDFVEYSQHLYLSENYPLSGPVTSTGLIWRSDYPREMTVRMTTGTSSSFSFYINEGDSITVSNGEYYSYTGFLTSITITSISGSSSGRTFVITPGILNYGYSSSLHSEGKIWDSSLLRKISFKVTSDIESFHNIDVVIDDGSTILTTSVTPGSFYCYIGLAKSIYIDHIGTFTDGTYQINVGVETLPQSIVGSGPLPSRLFDSDSPRLVLFKVTATDYSFNVIVNDGSISRTAHLSENGAFNQGVYIYSGLAKSIIFEPEASSEGDYELIFDSSSGSFAGKVYSDRLFDSHILRTVSFYTHYAGGAGYWINIYTSGNAIISTYLDNQNPGLREYTYVGSAISITTDIEPTTSGDFTLTINPISIPESPRPQANIDQVSSQPAKLGEEIIISGHASGGSGSIQYNWRNEIGDILGSTSQLSISNLPSGANKIYFKVHQNGKWSEEAGQILIVKSNTAPIPVIQMPTMGEDFLFWESITFDASESTDTDHDLLTYEWNFGDEKTSIGNICSHAYSYLDSFYYHSQTVTVTLSVSDGFSPAQTTTITIDLFTTTSPEVTPNLVWTTQSVLTGSQKDSASYCYSPEIDILGDGTIDWNYPIKEYKYTNTLNLMRIINYYIVRTANINKIEGTVQVTIVITSLTPGKIMFSSLLLKEIILTLDSSFDDSDNDGLDDDVEAYTYGTNPDDSDTDDDGLSDKEEITGYLQNGNLIQTDPILYDTDADGLGDKFEKDITHTNPCPPLGWDTDGDGIGDGNEYMVWSYISPNAWLTDFDGDLKLNNLLDIDSDDDELNDGDENWPYNTLPYDSDSDDDGMTDGDEAAYWAAITEIPEYLRRANLRNRDSDNDGLSDGEEVSGSLNTLFEPHPTLPYNPDSDGDSISDYIEIVSGTNPNVNNNVPGTRSDDDDGDGLLNDEETIWQTNPNLPDSDFDGLTDYEEVNIYYTNPNSPHSDTDGLYDGWIDTNKDQIWDAGEEAMGEIGDPGNGFAGGYGTDPNLPNTDFDLLDDDDEIAYWNSISSTALTTNLDNDNIINNLRDSDSDNDSLPDGDPDDIDPLVDLTVTVKIIEILQLEDVEWGWPMYDGDFYVWVKCDKAKFLFPWWYPTISKKSIEPIKSDDTNIEPSEMGNVEFTFNVPDDEDVRTITIYLFDDDGGEEDTLQNSLDHDELCDISRDPGQGDENNPDGGTIELSYNLEYGQWSDDDSVVGDGSGYGHTNGEEDGSSSTDENDCELWFDIMQNDYDDDGLTYWYETKSKNTDPVEFTEADVDVDGLAGSQEIEQGSKPFLSNSDMDKLTDYQEYLLGCNPTHWSGIIHKLPFRNVTVEENSFTTEVNGITGDERDLTTDDDVSILGIDSPGKLLYPAIGDPEFIDKSTSLNLEIYLLYDTLNSITLTSIDSSNFYWWNWDLISFDDLYYDNIGMYILKCSVMLPSEIPIGLYDLTIYTSSTHYTAMHSVQVLDSFESSFTFIQLTDIHIGEGFLTPKGNIGDFLAILNRISKLEQPSFVIITGDLTENGLSEEFKYFKACLLKCGLPVFLSPGNHDYGGISAPYPGGSIDYYNEYLNPKFERKSEIKGNFNDYSFDYNNFHFISFDSGSVTSIFLTIPAPRLSGLTTAQLNWMASDYAMYDNGLKHTFIFTHGPIVGHEGGATHDTIAIIEGSPVIIKDRDPPFVEWVNGADMTVEAVFVGHTHEDWIFFDVNVENMNLATIPWKPNPTGMNSLSYNECTSYYIETNSACKNYP